MRWHGQPVVIHGRLLLEGAVKDLFHIVEPEGAHCRAGQGVGRGGEGSVDNVHSFSIVSRFVRAGRRFWRDQILVKDSVRMTVVKLFTDFVKVEWEIARDGAVESWLEEWRPTVSELVRSATVRLAHAGNPRIDGLKIGCEKVGNVKWKPRHLPRVRSSKTYLAAVHVLDGRLAERKVNVVAVSERANEIGSCREENKKNAQFRLSFFSSTAPIHNKGASIKPSTPFLCRSVFPAHALLSRSLPFLYIAIIQSTSRGQFIKL